MTIKELSNLFYLEKEIDKLQEELEEIGEIGSSTIDSSPKTKKISKKVEQIVLKKCNLMELIVKSQIKCIEERCKIENYIRSITDPKIRLIIRLRFIDFKNWYEIADEITPKNKELVNSKTPYMQLKRFFEKNLKK